MKALIIGSVALVILSTSVGVGIGYGLFNQEQSEATTESAIPEPATTTQTTSTTSASLIPKDYIAYAADASIPDNHYIYVHEIIDNNAQPELKLPRPFYSKLPYVTYNEGESRIEVAGDLFSKNNVYHYYVDPVSGEYERVTESLFEVGRAWATLTYTPEFGTLLKGRCRRFILFIHVFAILRSASHKYLLRPHEVVVERDLTIGEHTNI